ncbi:MAG: CDGSH iron-sulfur domain-containing protein [Sporichthyaceae bacterium]
MASRRPVRVRVEPSGPVYVDGPAEILADGYEPQVVDRFRVAICTCRCSARYPLCDGSHLAAKDADA